MTPDIEKKLTELGQALDSDESIVKNVMSRIEGKKIELPQPTHNFWRIIMKSKMIKYAAAAVVVIAVLVGINRFGGTIDGTSVSWADVQTAFLAQSWVHIKYDNGTASWYNLKTGDSCHKQLFSSGNRFVYINQSKNLRQDYTPELGHHITEDRPTIYRDGVIPSYESKTAWDRIIGHWEKIAQKRDSKYWDVEITTDTIDDKSTVRFDIYYIDALGSKLLTKQLWADPSTKLPIKIKEKLTTQAQKNQSREYITGIFSFPETGPHSIYDLGVPKDLPIAKDYGKEFIPYINEVIEAGRVALTSFPLSYLSITWSEERNEEIEIVYRHGEKICHYHFLNLSDVVKYSIEPNSTAQEILQWTQTQIPIGVAVFDGQNSYIRRNPHPDYLSHEKNAKSEVRVIRGKSLYVSSEPHEEFWEYAHHEPSRFEFISDVNEKFGNYIGLRMNMGDIRRDYFIDPKHDYMQVQNIWWKLQDGQWEKEREYIAIETTQLPDGQWYVTKRNQIIYPDSERGTGGSENNYIIDIKLLEANEFPPDIFNGEKLLEGAKIETY